MKPVNPLSGALGGNNPMSKLQQQFSGFMQNPMQFLMQRKINIPQEYQGSPKDMAQYLMNNGQMSQDTFNKISQMVNQMGIQLN